MEDLPGKVCVSCGKLTHDYSQFKCPNCGKMAIDRCYSCREKHTKYKCTHCDFQGP